MKFRAKLSKEGLVILLNILQSLEKISAQAVIFLNDDSFKIALINESIDSPKCFADISSQQLFTEYRIESQSSNSIMFEVSLVQLSQAVNSGKMAIQSQIKLVKREGSACICFETKADDSILALDLYHDIPIKLMPTTEIVMYLPPQTAPPVVALELPKGRLLKNVLEKMAKFSKFVQLVGNQSGSLILKAESSAVTINTYFNNMQVRYVGNMNPARDVNNSSVCKLTIKKLTAVVGSIFLPTGKPILFFTEDQAAMIFIELEPPGLGTISFYLPVLMLDPDEDIVPESTD